jgi:hypothetical protein
MGTRQRIGTAPVRALGAVSVLLLVAVRPCTKQATAFAVIGTPERGTVYLELDGCRRILAGGGLRQAPPDLVARVEALTP